MISAQIERDAYDSIQKELDRWPRYTGYLERLNYALHPANGWIAHQVKAEGGALYTHRNDQQELMAVTMLVPHPKDPHGDYELYVLVRADMTHERFRQDSGGATNAGAMGTEAVRWTLERAHLDHPNGIVFVRIRTEHEGAQHIAAKVGFHFVVDGKGTRITTSETIQGTLITFYVMRHHPSP
jgi:hypothetical protein